MGEAIGEGRLHGRCVGKRVMHETHNITSISMYSIMHIMYTMYNIMHVVHPMYIILYCIVYILCILGTYLCGCYALYAYYVRTYVASYIRLCMLHYSWSACNKYRNIHIRWVMCVSMSIP